MVVSFLGQLLVCCQFLDGFTWAESSQLTIFWGIFVSQMRWNVAPLEDETN